MSQIKNSRPFRGESQTSSRGSTRICPGTQSISLEPITGPAVPLTRNLLSEFRSRGVSAGYSCRRLSAGDLRFLSGVGPVTRPGHRVLIFKTHLCNVIISRFGGLSSLERKFGVNLSKIAISVKCPAVESALAYLTWSNFTRKLWDLELESIFSVSSGIITWRL